MMWKRNPQAPQRMAEQVAMKGDAPYVRVQIMGENNFTRVIDLPADAVLNAPYDDKAEIIGTILDKLAEVAKKEMDLKNGK